MRILYIITSGDAGGAQKYVLELARYFKGSIAAGTEHVWLSEQAHALGLQYHPLPHLKRSLHPWSDLRAFFDILKLIRSENPEVVHVNSSKAGVLASIAGKLLGKPIVFTAHGMYYFNDQSWWRRCAYFLAEWLASRFRNRIIAVSKHDRQHAIRHHLLQPQHIITVHNAVSEQNFETKGNARAALHLHTDELVLGTIANYYHRKGLDILIRAIAALPKEISFKCILIGSGPEQSALEMLIKEYSVEDKIILMGSIDHAATLLKAFDIFILPSRFEGFPYVLLEALSAHVPIVATNVGGNSEALGNAGVLVAPNNSTELAKGIEFLVRNKAQRVELAALTHHQANQFSLSRMLADTKSVYTSLI